MARPEKPILARKTGRFRLAQWWRELREGIGLNQHAVAKELGCSATHLSNIEHGRRLPSFDLLTRYEALVGSEGILRSMWQWARDEQAIETAGSRPPVPASVPLPGDRAEFMWDLEPRGEPVFAPLQRFKAGWEIRNAGRVIWKGRYMQQVGPRAPLYGSISLDDRTPVPSTAPGESAKVIVPMMAPQHPGESITYFHMVNSDGTRCWPDRYADGVYVRIRVRESVRLG